MKNRLLCSIAALFILVSISRFVYPNLSKQAVQKKNDAVIEQFDDKVDDVWEGDRKKAVEDGVINDDGYLVDDSGKVVSDYPVVFKKDLDRIYSDSKAYNNALKERQDLNVDFSRAALDLSDYGIYDGIYGYIKAPTIGLNIPIYLGAGEGNMARGGAHLMNTSLPIGGKNTNAAIAGHTGYFGRTVFDNIPRLSEGDKVSVTNYFATLNYRVVSKKEITSTETNDIYIVKDKDLLTLITCARMGKSRFEVICERV